MPEKVRRPRVPPELAARIDARRGDVPFEVWVRRALERALDGKMGPDSRDRAARPETVLPPAPARASEPQGLQSLVGPEDEDGRFLKATLENVLPPPSVAVFKCRARGCDFTAPSAAARCHRHPGALVPS